MLPFDLTDHIEMPASSPVLSVSQTYKAMASPAYVGEVRIKMWRLMLGIELIPEAMDPEWAERIHAYWRRQREVYGYEVGNEVTIQTDHFPEHEPPMTVLTTSAKVTAILPGERIKQGNA